MPRILSKYILKGIDLQTEIKRVAEVIDRIVYIDRIVRRKGRYIN